MIKLYALSGLGADQKAYSKLDLSEFDVVYVEWITPLEKESLANYVARLAHHYDIPKKGAHIMGVSFGGMCISELAKSYDFEKIILISSAKTKFELPRLYHYYKYISFHQLFPNKFFKKSNLIINWLFGVHLEQDKSILANIFKDSNPVFVKWAIDKIINWDNIQSSKSALHLHGDSDHIIPMQNVNYTTKINKAGHLMVLTHAAEISIAIRNYLLK
ncbi:alpha/beta hydrolase [Sphingobacterium sp. SRCM116780]|uniref:alpha/beta fold hydrolase n=1 Tax=Sphingobacterium sp. SRCM116780 TaxID=2907623 RepID=UPI001F2B2FDE|nr:alpha/beta hydrolase [Sphingobacterium sp. SRCM116780]UIR55364.1 alpha/beta hydrolase [Sphingobacterium sp. SRCM116780]